MKFELPKNGKPSNEKTIELLKKLKALADRGVDGEKDTAEIMLTRTLEKYGMTLEDIETPRLKKRFIDYKKEDERLLFQIVSSVIGNKGLKERSTKTNKQYRWRWMLSDSEFIELDNKFEFYYKLYETEKKNLFGAFAMKHQLFPTDSEAADWDDLTEEQKEQYRQQQRLSRGLKDASYLKQIEY